MRDDVKDADRQPAGGQLPKFRAHEYVREYVERWEKQDRKRRRLGHLLSPIRLAIDLFDNLIYAWRHLPVSQHETAGSVVLPVEEQLVRQQ